jgi:hypothetical protein
LEEGGFKSSVFSHGSAVKLYEDGEKSEGLDEDLFEMEEYRYENDRHRIISAMIISDLFIYLIKHFKANCINQAIYLG